MAENQVISCDFCCVGQLSKSSPSCPLGGGKKHRNWADQEWRPTSCHSVTGGFLQCWPWTCWFETLTHSWEQRKCGRSFGYALVSAALETRGGWGVAEPEAGMQKQETHHVVLSCCSFKPAMFAVHGGKGRREGLCTRNSALRWAS